LSGEGLPKDIELTRMNNMGRVFRCKYCGAIFVGLNDAKRHSERPDSQCLSLRRKEKSYG
jgi:predicted adenine nucleotide alpha hydrolase (AANH) superfamily ATPase